MKVIMQVVNNGTNVTLTDGFPYEKDDIIVFKEEPEIAYQVVERKIITARNIPSPLLIGEEPIIPVVLILKVQRGKLIKQED